LKLITPDTCPCPDLLPAFPTKRNHNYEITPLRTRIMTDGMGSIPDVPVSVRSNFNSSREERARREKKVLEQRRLREYRQHHLTGNGPWKRWMTVPHVSG